MTRRNNLVWRWWLHCLQGCRRTPIKHLNHNKNQCTFSCGYN